MHIRWLAVLVALSCSSVLCAGTGSNLELRKLKDQDQAPRLGNTDAIDWKTLSVQDAQRRKQVVAILADGGARTSEDYYNAALIYQHGDTAEEIELAYSLATLAVKLDPDNGPAKWLTAAAWDRIMMRLGKPQWYGTQYVRPKGADHWQLYTIDEKAVTDDDRKSLGVPSLAQAKAHVTDMH